MVTVALFYEYNEVIPGCAVGNTTRKVVALANIAGFHCCMITSVQRSQLAKHCVIRGLWINRSPPTWLRRVIKRIARHNWSAMQIPAQYKRVGNNPLHCCKCFRLSTSEKWSLIFWGHFFLKDSHSPKYYRKNAHWMTFFWFFKAVFYVGGEVKPENHFLMLELMLYSLKQVKS